MEASKPRIEQLRYAWLPVTGLAGAAGFARDLIGLELAELGDDLALLRSDERAYTLALDASGATMAPVLGLEVRSLAVLDRIAEALGARGLAATRLDAAACDRRRVRDGLAFRDHSGNPIELVVRPLNRARRPFLGRDAGVTDFAGAALRSLDPARDALLWCEALGATVADWVGDAVFLRLDDRHHRIALLPAAGRAGLLAVDFEVGGLDDVMQSRYLLAARQVRLLHGPGREPFSGQIFLAFEGPGGVVFRYVAGMDRIADPVAWRPRQFEAAPGSFCAWGSPCLIPEYGGAAAEGDRP